MTSLRHPRVVMFFGFCPNPLMMIMEYCEKGSLWGILRDCPNLKLLLLIRMLHDAASGMLFLHSCNPPIIHKDLKTLNILVSDAWNCKIADFGLSKIKELNNDTGEGAEDKAGASWNQTTGGSTAWASPEMLRGEQTDEFNDVYSFGTCIFECLTSEDPYKSIGETAIPFNVQQGKTPIHFYDKWDRIPGKFKMKDEVWKDVETLVLDCFKMEAGNRPSFKEVVKTCVVGGGVLVLAVVVVVVVASVVVKNELLNPNLNHTTASTTSGPFSAKATRTGGSRRDLRFWHPKRSRNSRTRR